LSGGLNGLVQTGQFVAANLIGNFGGGLNALIQTGQTLAANFVGGFNLPELAAAVEWGVVGSFGASFPALVHRLMVV